MAKFFPHWDGPFRINVTHPSTSSYTLDMGRMTTIYPTFHTSEIKLYHANDPLLFPTHELLKPGPILTTDGFAEHQIDRILDSRKHGQGWQFLVRWVGYRPEDDEWLQGQDLEDCEVLDRWYEAGGDGPMTAW
jgi:Chromo (CHRromatin Organisation MOdifier) domain